MKVELITKKGKLQLDGARIQIAGTDQTVMIRAELEEGASPVTIVMDDGKHEQTIPIKMLKIVNKRRGLVKAYSFRRGEKTVHVPTHYRHQPLRYKTRGKVI